MAWFFSTLWSKSEYLVPEKICKYMYPDISHSAKLHASWQKPFSQTTCTLTEAIQPNYMYPDRSHSAKLHVPWQKPFSQTTCTLTEAIQPNYMYPDRSHSAKLHVPWQKPFSQTTCTLTEAIQPNYMYPDRRHPAKIHVFWPVKWASMDTVEGSMYIWVTTEMARQASLAFKPTVWRQTKVLPCIRWTRP